MINEDTNTEAETEETLESDSVDIADDDGRVQPNSLSLEGALEAALEIEKEKDEANKKALETEPKSNEQNPELEVTYKKSKKAKDTPTKQESYRAPAEYTKQEQAEFLKLPPKIQEANLRLYNSRQSQLRELQEASKKYKDMESLTESIAPFVRAMGIKEPTPIAIQKAISLWQQVESAKDEASIKRETSKIWKAKGFEPPEDWETNENGHVPDAQFKALQDRQEMIENHLVQQEIAHTNAELTNMFVNFASIKNDDGTNRYPDLHMESGSDLAKEMGPLVNVQTPLGAKFLEQTKNRISDLDQVRFFEEAYKFLGGQINESFSAKPQSQNNHLQTASRAKASVPGQGAAPNSHNVKRYEKTEDAIAAALRHLGVTQ